MAPSGPALPPGSIVNDRPCCFCDPLRDRPPARPSSKSLDPSVRAFRRRFGLTADRRGGLLCTTRVWRSLSQWNVTERVSPVPGRARALTQPDRGPYEDDRRVDPRVVTLSGTLQPTFAQAPNLCEWTGPWMSSAAARVEARGSDRHAVADGKVLIVGGFDGANTVAAAELYDPATGTSSATGSLATSRSAHVAALLADGRVLIAGGLRMVNGAFVGRLASAELFDPGTGNFTAAASMSTDRQNAAATLLGNGKVLVTGGFGNTGFGISGWLPSAELFDPNSNAFSLTGPMATGRGLHQATRLQSGKVLVTGGFNAGGATASGELFDPAAGTFSPTGALKAARMSHTATLLPSGVVATHWRKQCFRRSRVDRAFQPGDRHLYVWHQPRECPSQSHCHAPADRQAADCRRRKRRRCVGQCGDRGQRGVRCASGDACCADSSHGRLAAQRQRPVRWRCSRKQRARLDDALRPAVLRHGLSRPGAQRTHRHATCLGSGAHRRWTVD